MVRPILFNTDMVRAILDGRKTVTRRKIEIDIVNQFDVEHGGKTVYAYMDQETGDCFSPTEVCRYQPGDILYVRETWNTKCSNCESICPAICSTPAYVYKADCPESDGRWRPSIHMPKEAARIFLRVTDVRVEHLKDMTLDDILAEGVVLRPEAFNDPENAYMQGKELFIRIWDSTIKKEQRDLCGWDANPWVWVIEFERCEKPEGWCV